MITAQSLKKQKNIQGFTLIELLVVIGILAVLLAIVLIAINPARQFAQANNTQRRSDVAAILNAIDQYAAENKGALPPGMPTTPLVSIPISSAAGGTGATFCNALVPTYIAALPRDPSPTASFTDCTNYVTQYTVSIGTASAGNTARVTVAAPLVELQTSISATR